MVTAMVTISSFPVEAAAWRQWTIKGHPIALASRLVAHVDLAVGSILVMKSSFCCWTVQALVMHLVLPIDSTILLLSDLILLKLLVGIRRQTSLTQRHQH